MQRWLAECKEIRTVNSRDKSGSILYAAGTAHQRIEEHETLSSQPSLHLSQEPMTFINYPKLVL